MIVVIPGMNHIMGTILMENVGDVPDLPLALASAVTVAGHGMGMGVAGTVTNKMSMKVSRHGINLV